MLRKMFRQYARKPQFWESTPFFIVLTIFLASVDFFSFREAFVATGLIGDPLKNTIFSAVLSSVMDIGIPLVLAQLINTQRAARLVSGFTVAVMLAATGFIASALITSGSGTEFTDFESLLDSAAMSSDSTADQTIPKIFLLIPVVTTSILTSLSLARSEFVRARIIEDLEMDMGELEAYIESLKKYNASEVLQDAERGVQKELNAIVQQDQQEVQGSKKNLRNQIKLHATPEQTAEVSGVVDAIPMLPEPELPPPAPSENLFVETRQKQPIPAAEPIQAIGTIPAEPVESAPVAPEQPTVTILQGTIPVEPVHVRTTGSENNEADE